MLKHWRAVLTVVAELCALPAALIIGLLILKWCERAEAREHYPGQYEHVAADVQDWFRSQKSPKTGGLCCSEADGLYVEEDIRSGHYWAKGGPFKEYVLVPDDVVIHDANRNGSPVLWWYFQDGTLQIRCYAPGGGV